MRIQWRFSEEELALFKTKKPKGQLYFALQFKYYEVHMDFCDSIENLSAKTIYKVAKSLGLSGKIQPLSQKTYATYRSEIRAYFQSKSASASDEILIKDWLVSNVFPQEVLSPEQLKDRVTQFLIQQKIEPMSEGALDRVIKSARLQHEEALFQLIDKGLSLEAKAYLDGLLLMNQNSSRLAMIKRWPGGLSLETILNEAAKLKFLKLIDLPACLNNIPNKALQRHYRNITTKYPSAIKEMPETHKYSLLAIFALIRQRQITDTLADLLIRLTKKIENSGENKLKKSLSQVVEIKKGCNRKTLLNTLISLILGQEEEIVKKAIYPVVPKERLEAIKKQDSNTPLSYETLVHEKSRSSYLKHYRRMLAPVLELLEFNINNSHYQPLIEAIHLIKSHLESGTTYYPSHLAIPLEGAIKNSHQSFVLENTEQEERVNRVSYELCVLRNLRDKLRIKEVWIKGAYQYRNPEEDVPQDFEEKKDYYTSLLNKPRSANYFIRHVKKQLNQYLATFNTELPKNKKVAILKKPSGHIRVAKLIEQPLPIHLEAIKEEVFKRWPNTSLLDVLKETDRFVNFIQAFIPSGPKEILDKEEIKKRLLLCILGYGTNTGLKSVSAGNEDLTYQDLKHVKLRYFDPDNLREAIRLVINQLLKIRSPEIWDYCTTAVASDSSHFTASDQNLMSQWHPRYHSKGVMIYWHVDTKSVCIYSQLKSCASSEVASMIEGVLRHCTDMDVQKNYVDTHGASEVGFAFSYMLDFDLLPRFKNIHTQKLYVADKEDLAKYPNLSLILARSINWDLIEAQYEQIIKYTVALKLGTANAEAIMKRFTRDNLQHPTYKALSELGKAIKTIFLCRYLGSEALRQEIHEGLNVVERWNGINDFIFYGKKGAFRSNNSEELQLSMLCLHLLQLSMVYINTVMLQQIFKESDWLARVSLEDKRAITPLLHEHINPYGVFILNLNTRLAIEHPDLKKAA